MAFHKQVRLVIVAVQGDAVMVVVLMDLEVGMVMDAWKQLAADQGVQPGRRVPPGDENTLPPLALLVPLDSDAVGGVLRGNAYEGRQEAGPDVFQADQADAGHSHSVHKLGSEWRRQYPG